MEATFKDCTDFLVDLGIEQVGHTGKTYLAHLIGVHGFIKKRSCPEELCRAGLFHSIYGTELFQGFKLPVERRDDVRALIGTRAEQLAYLNCAMDRDSFDAVVDSAEEIVRFRDRLTGAEVRLERVDFDDLCRVHLYDWLEQVPRCERWDYRRSAYRRMAERIGPEALTIYDEVFAQEQPRCEAGS